LFDKHSTRTRVSFQVGMAQLGGLGIELRSQDTQINRGEPLRDTARVLSRYADALCIRTFAQADLETWAASSSIPVINALSDVYHPCQILADLLTILEQYGSLAGRKVVYIGDGNNILHSWISACCLLDIELVMSVPEGYEPDPAVLEACAAIGWRGRPPRLVRDPREAVAGAHALYTDVWTSMGQESERERRLADFKGYQINRELVAAAGTGPMVLHCLPAHRGEEITDDTFESSAEEIFRQAENRLHVQKALLLSLLAPSAAEQFNRENPAGDTV
jgi:ornithine carbamoyltransferase